MAEFIEVLKQKKRMCKKYSKSNCAYCPLEDFVEINCDAEINANPQEAESIIMSWAKENPIKTNADKFEEVFGAKIRITSCNAIDTDCSISCADCKYKDFWSKEYEEPKG